MWDKIKEHKDVFSAGIVIGAVILLILILIFKYIYSELFVDENDINPISKSLLAYADMLDPPYTRV